MRCQVFSVRGIISKRCGKAITRHRRGLLALENPPFFRILSYWGAFSAAGSGVHFCGLLLRSDVDTCAISPRQATNPLERLYG